MTLAGRTTFAVIVPYRPADATRRAAWERVAEQWDRDFPSALTWVDDGGDPFSRGGSVNLGIGRSNADLFVIADADTLVDHEQVQTAIDLAASAPGLVVAFDRFMYLGRGGSRQVIEGYTGDWEPFGEWSLPDTVSSCVALSRETWDTVGGFDPRFRAWGYEDVQLEVACATLVAPTRRVPGTAWHLYHQPTSERPAVNAGMLDEYLRLRDDPAGMRAHIDGIRVSA